MRGDLACDIARAMICLDSQACYPLSGVMNMYMLYTWRCGPDVVHTFRLRSCVFIYRSHCYDYQVPDYIAVMSIFIGVPGLSWLG